MHQNSNIKIVPALGCWLLLLCCILGCTCSNNQSLGRAVQCDPTYGYRPTCWRYWPGCCPTGPEQRWYGTPTRPADGEYIPTPQAEHLPQAPQKPMESPNPGDLWQ